MPIPCLCSSSSSELSSFLLGFFLFLVIFPVSTICGRTTLLDYQMHKEAFKTSTDAISEMDGAQTFLVAFLAKQMRSGVAGTVLPLLPALHYGLCDLLVWLHLIDAEAFLKDGATYDALGSLIASIAG